MKKLLVILTALAFVVGFSTASFAIITGSAHDFSAAGWNSTGEICVTCHTPHNADTTVASSPLWNHEVTTATFTLYTSGTLDATLGQPAGVSKLCLSCHDGTVALENFGTTTTGTTMIGSVNAAADLTTDISNDHPVSFTYDAALATSDGEIYDPTSQTSGLGGTIDADMLFGTTPGSKTLECASCHDPHNTPGIAKLLRKDNAGSTLCLTCHDK